MSTTLGEVSNKSSDTNTVSRCLCVCVCVCVCVHRENDCFACNIIQIHERKEGRQRSTRMTSHRYSMLVMGGPFITCCRREHPSVSPPAESFSLSLSSRVPCIYTFSFSFLHGYLIFYSFNVPLFSPCTCACASLSLSLSLSLSVSLAPLLTCLSCLSLPASPSSLPLPLSLSLSTCFYRTASSFHNIISRYQ